MGARIKIKKSLPIGIDYDSLMNPIHEGHLSMHGEPLFVAVTEIIYKLEPACCFLFSTSQSRSVPCIMYTVCMIRLLV